MLPTVGGVSRRRALKGGDFQGPTAGNVWVMSEASRELLRTDVDGGTFVLRNAVSADLPDILRLLMADSVGVTRENLVQMDPYREAFTAIDTDPAHQLVVGDFLGIDGVMPTVATFQLSVIPGLSRHGSWRSQIEAVRVSVDLRGKGLGTLMIQWAIDESRRRGCSMVQLTTDKSRTDAQRFYGRLGFAGSHVGMKLIL